MFRSQWCQWFDLCLFDLLIFLSCIRCLTRTQVRRCNTRQVHVANTTRAASALVQSNKGASESAAIVCNSHGWHQLITQLQWNSMKKYEELQKKDSLETFTWISQAPLFVDQAADGLWETRPDLLVVAVSAVTVEAGGSLAGARRAEKAESEKPWLDEANIDQIFQWGLKMMPTMTFHDISCFERANDHRITQCSCNTLGPVKSFRSFENYFVWLASVCFGFALECSHHLFILTVQQLRQSLLYPGKFSQARTKLQ